MTTHAGPHGPRILALAPLAHMAGETKVMKGLLVVGCNVWRILVTVITDAAAGIIGKVMVALRALRIGMILMIKAHGQ